MFEASDSCVACSEWSGSRCLGMRGWWVERQRRSGNMDDGCLVNKLLRVGPVSLRPNHCAFSFGGILSWVHSWEPWDAVTLTTQLGRVNWRVDPSPYLEMSMKEESKGRAKNGEIFRDGKKGSRYLHGC